MGRPGEGGGGFEFESRYSEQGIIFFGKLAKILEERYVIQTKEIM